MNSNVGSRAALDDARQITSSLRRARRTMEYGVMNAGAAVNILSQDGNVIKQTLDIQKYGLKNALNTSKSRLSRLKNLQIIEKWSLRLSISFFIVVVAYIVAKRTRVLQLSAFIANNTYSRTIKPWNHTNADLISNDSVVLDFTDNFDETSLNNLELVNIPTIDGDFEVDDCLEACTDGSEMSMTPKTESTGTYDDEVGVAVDLAIDESVVEVKLADEVEEYRQNIDDLYIVDDGVDVGNEEL